jgi:hypothetical protein
MTNNDINGRPILDVDDFITHVCGGDAQLAYDAMNAHVEGTPDLMDAPDIMAVLDAHWWSDSFIDEVADVAFPDDEDREDSTPMCTGHPMRPDA